MKKIVLLLLSASMLISVCGCQTTKTGNQEGKVALKWIMPGPGEQEDSQKVWIEFNKKLKEYPEMENVDVDIEVIPASDYKQKFLLMQTSGEQIDLAQTYTLNFATESRNGVFLPLDDLISKTIKLKNVLPDWEWDFGKVDGKTYIVPNNQMMVSAVWGFRTPKNLADKYMDKEKIQNTIFKNKTFNKECYSVLEEYLDTLAANGELRKGFVTGTQTTLGYENIESIYAFNIFDEHPKIVNLRQTDEFKALCEYADKWYKKGYIRPDILTVTPADDYGKADGYTLWTEQTWKNWKENDKSKYTMETEPIMYANYYYMPAKSAAGGTAIMATSKHSKEALRLIELMNSEEGKELYNLLVYGIEGEHFEKVNDERINLHYKSDPTSSDKYGLWRWVVGNTYYAYKVQTDTDDFKDYLFNELNCGDKTIRSKLLGFQPDLTEISSKIAQVNAVSGEYSGSLGNGVSGDWQKTYQEFSDKLEKSGNSEIIQELQRQVDDFLANKK